MKSNKVLDEVNEELWKIGAKYDLKFRDWLYVLEEMRVQITLSWVMKDFNKDGNYEIKMVVGEE